MIADSEEDPALMDNHRDRPEVREALAGRIGTSRRYSLTLERPMMYVAIPLPEDMGVIRTSMAVTTIEEALGPIRVKIVLGGIIIALIAALISLVISRRISHPLEEMKNGAGHFARGNLEYRLPVPESEEMGELARAMNEAILEQAFVNTLNNAIAYSEPGGEVHVEVSRNDAEVTIGFHDQGIGIEKQHLPRIFERFYRVDRGRSRDHGGTGLGLAIVKHIVEAHGGRVTVESTPGRGSTFRVHLPRG